MSISPIVQTVSVKVSPARAFALFSENMGQWWPTGKTIGRNLHAAIVLEPHAGGRWFERDAEGNETAWGKVLAWEPPSRILLAWQINSAWRHDPDFSTEVEMRFTPAPGGGTLVRLEHRNLERFGADAEKLAGQLGGGWPAILAGFSLFADTTN